METAWTADELAFRDEVRAFLDAALTPELRAAGRSMTSVYAEKSVAMAWQSRWVRYGWPAVQ